jgi:hypothetical protein
VEGKERAPLQSAALLLKCLKILENATFLSDNNKVIFSILFARFASITLLSTMFFLLSAVMVLPCLLLSATYIILQGIISFCSFQTHLLSLNRKLSPKCPPLPFVGVILNIIELLSGNCILI